VVIKEKYVDRALRFVGGAVQLNPVTGIQNYMAALKSW
jgi:hypothetical protein